MGKLIGKKSLSHQNVLRISSRIVEEFKAWRKRDLSTLHVIYLVFDAVRMGGRTKEKEAVLVAWAFLGDGSRELVGVSLGNSESSNAWKGFLEHLLIREMSVPMLTVIDGCPGLIKAVDEVFPESDKQLSTQRRVPKAFGIQEEVEHEVPLSSTVPDRKYRRLSDLLQISLPALAQNTDDQ